MLIRHAAVWLVCFLSNLLNPNRLHVCRFHPSCGTYASRAVLERGILQGSRLAAMRLLKCRPGGPLGYDPLSFHKAK